MDRSDDTLERRDRLFRREGRSSPRLGVDDRIIADNPPSASDDLRLDPDADW